MEDGAKVDLIFLTAFLNAMINAKDLEYFMYTVEKFQKMRINGDVKFFSSLVRGFTKFKMFDRVAEIETKLLSMQLNESDYHVLLHSKCKPINQQIIVGIRGEWDTLPEFLATMENGSERKIRTWNILLTGHSHHSDSTSLITTFNAIPVPHRDTSTYNTMISHFLIQKNPHLTQEFITLLNASGLRYDKVTYSLLIKARSEASDLEGVEKVFRVVDDSDTRHCEAMYRSVGKYFLSVNELGELRNLEKLMKENSVYPSVNYYERYPLEKRGLLKDFSVSLYEWKRGIG